MAHTQWQQLLPDLFSFADACNVYLLRFGDQGIAVDYGSGAWRTRLGEIGVARLEHVVLTHAHRDQLYGLYRHPDPSITVHAPAAETQFLQPAPLAKRQARIRAGEQRRMRFAVKVPAKADKGRHLLTADLQLDDQLLGEACVALVEVS